MLTHPFSITFHNKLDSSHIKSGRSSSWTLSNITARFQVQKRKIQYVLKVRLYRVTLERLFCPRLALWSQCNIVTTTILLRMFRSPKWSLYRLLRLPRRHKDVLLQSGLLRQVGLTLHVVLSAGFLAHYAMIDLFGYLQNSILRTLVWGSRLHMLFDQTERRVLCSPSPFEAGASLLSAKKKISPLWSTNFRPV